jgi:hypothetical protein
MQQAKIATPWLTGVRDGRHMLSSLTVEVHVAAQEREIAIVWLEQGCLFWESTNRIPFRELVSLTVTRS